jgi:hypothetical protein
MEEKREEPVKKRGSTCQHFTSLLFFLLSASSLTQLSSFTTSSRPQ